MPILLRPPMCVRHREVKCSMFNYGPKSNKNKKKRQHTINVQMHQAFLPLHFIDHQPSGQLARRQSSPESIKFIPVNLFVSFIAIIRHQASFILPTNSMIEQLNGSKQNE